MLRKIRQAEILDPLSNSPQSVDAMGFAKHQVESGLRGLEAMISQSLQTNPSGFAAGTNFPTIADLCIVPQAYSAKRFGVDVAQFPSLALVLSRCEGIPAFQMSHADVQVDAPKA